MNESKIDIVGIKEFRNSAVVTGVLAFFIISMCVYLGLYMRPALDDFCFAHTNQNFNSLLAAVSNEWTVFNGRWATSTIRYFYYEYVGIGSNYWLVAIISLLSIFGASWCVAKVFYQTAITRYCATLFFATVFISLASKIEDLIFWGDGLTNYTLAYSLTALSIYLFYKTSSSVGWLTSIVLAVVLTLTSGLVELFLLPLWFFMFLIFIKSANKVKLMPFVLITFVGSCLSIFAPGNASRVTRVDGTIAPIDLLTETLTYGLRGLLLPILALYLISHLPFIKAIVVQMTQEVSNRFNKKSRLLITLFALTYPPAIIFILLLSLGAPGPGRAHNLSLFTIILCWPVIISVINFLKPRQFLLKPINIALAILGTVMLFGVNAREMLEDIASGNAKSYSERFDIERLSLEQQPSGSDVILSYNGAIPNTAHEGLFFATHDKKDWINRCVAYYFDLGSIEVDRTE